MGPGCPSVCNHRAATWVGSELDMQVPQLKTWPTVPLRTLPGGLLHLLLYTQKAMCYTQLWQCLTRASHYISYEYENLSTTHKLGKCFQKKKCGPVRYDPHGTRTNFTSCPLSFTCMVASTPFLTHRLFNVKNFKYI